MGEAREALKAVPNDSSDDDDFDQNRPLVSNATRNPELVKKFKEALKAESMTEVQAERAATLMLESMAAVRKAERLSNWANVQDDLDEEDDYVEYPGPERAIAPRLEREEGEPAGMPASTQPAKKFKADDADGPEQQE